MGLAPYRKPADKSRKQEERNGKLPQGGKQINSGRTPRSRRDNTLGLFLLESRTTKASSYRVDGHEFLDIKRQGVLQPPGYLPGMQVDLENVGLSLAVIELEDLVDLLEELRVLRERS